MSIARNFVLKYIRTHMGHERHDCRDEIFQAINDGLHSEFREDTVPGLIYFGVRTLLENDDRFYTLINSADFMDCVESYTDMLKDGIATEVDELAVKLKVNRLPQSIMLATAPRKARYETFIVRKINEIYEKYTTNKASFVRNLKAPKQEWPYDPVILTDMTFDDAQEFCDLLNSIADTTHKFFKTIDKNRTYYVYKAIR